MTGDTSTTLSPLTPSTKYVFSVGIVTDDGQYGPLTTATVTTGMQSGGLYIAIQMIVIGHVLAMSNGRVKTHPKIIS